MSAAETDNKNHPSDDRHEWSLLDDVTYLNHGSFGPSPRVVQNAREEWSRRLESQPMDFYVRQMEDQLDTAGRRLGEFVGAEPRDLVFVDNATVGMNIVAASVRLNAGDEVLLTDHEYGAVTRIWRTACQATGANLVIGKLPKPTVADDELTTSFLEAVTDKTRLIVVSHVTSPTSLILPVKQICQRARELNVPVCVDGPHAPAMIPVNINNIGCDYYTASCHKWLSAPFGTGFLYVARRLQQTLRPANTSWGRSISGRPFSWQDEFNWIGTRDPAAFLSIPTAIEFLESKGLETFRRRTHQLAQSAQHRITELTGMEADVADASDRFGSMITLPLPTTNWQPPKHGRRDPLQDALWNQHKIEIPLISWNGRRFIRVSCHLYNTQSDIDRLIEGLAKLL